MPDAAQRAPLNVAIAGLGAIGLPVARWLASGGIDGLRLAAVSANDKAKAEKKLAGVDPMPPIVDLADLVAAGDVIVECLPPERFADIAQPAVEAGKVLIALTPCSLLEHWALVDRAKATGARIVIPTGALVGLMPSAPRPRASFTRPARRRASPPRASRPPSSWSSRDSTWTR